MRIDFGGVSVFVKNREHKKSVVRISRNQALRVQTEGTLYPRYVNAFLNYGTGESMTEYPVIIERIAVKGKIF